MSSIYIYIYYMHTCAVLRKRENCITRAYKPPRPASVFTIISVARGMIYFFVYYDILYACASVCFLFLSQYLLSLAIQHQRIYPLPYSLCTFNIIWYCIIYYIVYTYILLWGEGRRIKTSPCTRFPVHYKKMSRQKYWYNISLCYYSMAETLQRVFTRILKISL